MTALKELTPTLTPNMPPERSNLVLRLTTLAESILSWSFISINLPKKLISVFESDQNPSLRPGASWKDTILNTQIPQLFFELHLKVSSIQHFKYYIITKSRQIILFVYFYTLYHSFLTKFSITGEA